MGTQLRVVDESMGGQVLADFVVTIENEGPGDPTISEIVEARVREDARRVLAGPDLDVSTALVRPFGAEDRGHGRFGLSRGHAVDVDAQVQRAFAAFRAGALRVIIDGRRAEDLDQAVRLGDTSGATFVKLEPLFGG